MPGMPKVYAATSMLADPGYLSKLAVIDFQITDFNFNDAVSRILNENEMSVS